MIARQKLVKFARILLAKIARKSILVMSVKKKTLVHYARKDNARFVLRTPAWSLRWMFRLWKLNGGS